MRYSYSPAKALDQALEFSPGNPQKRIAVVLPSTDETLRLSMQVGQAKVVGTAPGMIGLSPALRSAASGSPSPLMLIFTDQFTRPADTSILAVLAGMQMFLSPLEYLLNGKYAYTVGAWTRGGLAWLPPGAPIEGVLSLIVRHLQDCDTLEHEWVERTRQSMRLREQRVHIARRQLRYLHSSVANAYMDAPENPEASLLLRRIAALDGALDRKEFA